MKVSISRTTTTMNLSEVTSSKAKLAVYDSKPSGSGYEDDNV